MVGHHWIPWFNNPSSGSITVTTAKQEQDITNICTRKTRIRHHICHTVALSAFCLCLFVICVALSVLYNSESDSKPRWRNLLFEYQNISDHYHTISKVNAELKRDSEVLKEQNKVLNRTAVKLLSHNVALSLAREELTEQIFNLTSTNSHLTQELERLVQVTVQQIEKELNMSESIKHLEDSINQQEEEKQQLSEMIDLLKDELIQVKEKNQELLEINDKFKGEVQNLNEKLGAYMSDDCEEENMKLQDRVTELQEENQNMTEVVMKEREEAADQEESRRKEIEEIKEAYLSLDLYCPVINQKTKERICKKCMDGWILFEKKCYHISSRLLTWSSSRAWCQTQGGDLLIINSEPEQNFIFESSRAQQQSSSRLWIGMTDSELEGEWRWTDSSLVSSNKQFWLSRPGAGTEPDDWKQDDPAGEDCGHIDTSEDTQTSWMDGSCKISYRWICEKSV